MSDLTLKLFAVGNNTPTEFEVATLGGILRPCPFCASQHIVFTNIDDEAASKDDDLVRCHCHACGAEGPFRDTRLNALLVWNRSE